VVTEEVYLRLEAKQGERMELLIQIAQVWILVMIWSKIDELLEEAKKI